MRADVDYIKRKFSEFNELMFAGRLPEIPVRECDAASYLGQCMSKVRTLSDGRREYHSFELRISRRLDLPENVVEDVIIHEMIHYFILVNGLHDSSAHGNIFKSIMHSINAAYGRNISVRHKLSDEETQQLHKPTGKNRLIAVIQLRDGQLLLKSIPTTANSLLDFRRKLSGASNVGSVKYYMTTNPYFAHLSVSTSLRCTPIDEATLSIHLRDAVEIKE